jgi:hypothetical protein
VVRKSIQSLEIDGNLDLLVNDIAEHRAERAEEDEIFANVREKEETLTRMRQDFTEEQRKREDEEKHLKAELLRLRVSD